jgi:uncharacterized protein (DUF362 family)
MSTPVGIVQSQDSPLSITQSIQEALDLIQFQPEEPVHTVAIKPNLSYYWDASTGHTTDPRVVAGIIHWLRRTWGQQIDIRVVEADASAMRTKWAFQMLGYTKLATKLDVELVNLSESPSHEHTVNVQGRTVVFQIPQLLTDIDLLINVPKVKTLYSGNPPVTCALKNIFGCIASPRKIKYHPILNEAIIGINKIVPPHLTIVDGLVALGTTPYKLGLILASVDPFAIDWIAAQLLNYNPAHIGYLKLAIRENMGNPDTITTRGMDLQQLPKIPKKRGLNSGRLMQLHLRLLKLYCKIVGDIIPPVLEGI